MVSTQKLRYKLDLIIVEKQRIHITWLSIPASSGPLGVGKTLTAEGLSEYLERPLYAVSPSFIRSF